MLVIKIELHSAITKEVTEIGRAVIANDGSGTKESGNYWMKLYGENGELLEGASVGFRRNWPRLQKNCWELLSALLKDIYK